MLNRISHSFTSLTREISCSTIEINFIFPHNHVIFSIFSCKNILKLHNRQEKKSFHNNNITCFVNDIRFFLIESFAIMNLSAVHKTKLITLHNLGKDVRTFLPAMFLRAIWERTWWQFDRNTVAISPFNEEPS